MDVQLQQSTVAASRNGASTGHRRASAAKPPIQNGWKANKGGGVGQVRGGRKGHQRHEDYAVGGGSRQTGGRRGGHFWEENGNIPQWWRGGRGGRTVVNNKERYLLATCQFIVGDTTNLTAYEGDPDLVMDWASIEELRVHDSLPSCPICLDAPIAAKMTKCGHVYCWSCVLHYLALSDKPWRPCPICFEAIYVEQLRSVASRPTEGARDECTLRLIRRSKRSTVCVPAGEGEEGDDRFAKFVRASNETVIDTIIERERGELGRKYLSDKDEPESCFILAALRSLDRRLEEVMRRDVEGEKESRSPTDGSAMKCKRDDGDVHYFYQATDGSSTFLSPFTIRQLTVEFGSMSRCPSTVGGSVVHRSVDTMDEGRREKHKHLAHLPLGTAFTFVELCLPDLGEETKRQFNDEVCRRRSRRLREEEEENRRARRAEQWIEAMLYKQGAVVVDRQRSPSPIVHLQRVDSEQHRLKDGWRQGGRATQPSIDLLADAVSPPLGGLDIHLPVEQIDLQGAVNDGSPPSFAQMLCNPPSSSAPPSRMAPSSPSTLQLGDMIVVGGRQKQMKKKNKKLQRKEDMQP